MGAVEAQTQGPPGPVVVSPEVTAERHVKFRIHAPKAESAALFTTDMPGGFAPRPMTQGEDGVWELTIESVAPGTYRYLFRVDEMFVPDPRNQSFSESNGNPWSVWKTPAPKRA